MSLFKLPILIAMIVVLTGGGVDAFVSSPSPTNAVCRFTTTTTTTTPLQSPFSSQLNFFSGYEMGGLDAVNTDHEKKNNKNKENQENASLDETEDPLFLASLVTKAIIILIIKTAKDIVNYPPNLLDQYNRYQQMRNQEIANVKPEESSEEVEDPAFVMTATATTTTSATSATTQEPLTYPNPQPQSQNMPLPLELTKTNPFILLAKFLGVLTYKTMHDAIYYPALWINDYLHPPHNDDDAYYYY
jgi:hypothetical protein